MNPMFFEAFDTEIAEFENVRWEGVGEAGEMKIEDGDKDAISFEIWKSFGFSDADAFSFAVTEARPAERTIEDLFKFFGIE